MSEKLNLGEIAYKAQMSEYEFDAGTVGTLVRLLRGLLEVEPIVTVGYYQICPYCLGRSDPAAGQITVVHYKTCVWWSARERCEL